METVYKTTVVGLKTYMYVKTMIMLYLTWYRNVEKKERNLHFLFKKERNLDRNLTCMI